MQGKEVVVNLFDGQVKNEPGKIIGSGINSKGDEVYLVEMDNAPEKGDFHIGKAQVKNGKCWILSVYQDELKVKEAA